MMLTKAYRTLGLRLSAPTMSASFPIYTPQKHSATARNSRNSQLTTPKRSGRISHRNTPYSTTTSRALQRAKQSQNGTAENQEDQLIGETSYEEPTQSQRKKSPYSMHGAKNGNSQQYDEEEEKTDEDQPEDAEDQDFRITPSRNIFSRTNTPVKTPTKSPKGEPRSPLATGKKTWGQWLGAILPESVKKPVKAILGAPEDMTSQVAEQTKELVIGTPKKGVVMDEDHDGIYSLPGSFGKPEVERRTKPPMLEYEHDAGNTSYGSEFDISKSFGSTPSRVNPSGLFVYDKPKSTTSIAPSRRERRSTMSTPLKSNKSLPAVSSLHKPNNFIERMRTAKKSHRYDPYARRTTAKEKIQLTQDEGKELAPEEKLKLLKQRQKERKIAELEDKYEMREALKAMGQPVPDEDEQMPDSDTEQGTKDKGKGRERSLSVSRPLNPTVEDVAEDGSPTKALAIAPSSPPKSPIKKVQRESPKAMPSRNLFEPSAPAPSFLLSGDTSDEPFKISTAPPPPEIPNINFNGSPSSWSFSSDSSDKENISSAPPPPPTMSHAQLPAPLTVSSQPPVVAGGLFGSTAPQQPAGGFGLGPPKEPTAVGRQRSQAEKFKPMRSSSLRESRSVADEDEKENEPEKDKENAGESSKKGSETELKKGLTQQAQGSQNVFTKPALKENVGVLNLGKSDVKVDIRAKVEAVSVILFVPSRQFSNGFIQVPSKQLSTSIVWPLDNSFGSTVTKEAIAKMWTGRLAEYPSGFGDMFFQAVKV